MGGRREFTGSSGGGGGGSSGSGSGNSSSRSSSSSSGLETQVSRGQEAQGELLHGGQNGVSSSTVGGGDKVRQVRVRGLEAQKHGGGVVGRPGWASCEEQECTYEARRRWSRAAWSVGGQGRL